ncbi:MAG: glutamine--tRNA ligase/YqeY domain fusion protein, partial [Polyangiaceae bacterium]|nr:glutamine--tRNA ligase/YqeY domain fusion protein [Polyangiaceae bacterium]
MTSEATHAKADEKATGSAPSNFIREIIEADRQAGKHNGRVVTRFPPEPNGYLHIGHAKSICLNFGLAREFGGKCNLRFDDTNPTTEDMEYVEAIQRDVKWLGFDWGDGLYFASGYYDKLYDFAGELIKRGKAYVCSLSEEDIRKYRGTVMEPGTPSPYRERSVEENLDLFRRMRAGEFPDGAHILRAKIDMASSNMKMRDPPLYRIRHATHYKTGDAWCIYPLYDFAHSLSDWIEGITHSICTLEFENNRELYDWFLEALDLPNRPQQIEFARLNLTSTVMSKRKLLELVGKKHVAGWDDPRMPTITGMRRRGVTPEALRQFCERVGVAKNNSTVELALFEHVLREDLDRRSPRVLAVLKPLRVVIENFPEGKAEELLAPYFPPEAKREGSRVLPFSRVLYIERDDFMENPPKDFFRLAPGKEVRLRYAYVIRCNSVVKDEATGEIVELRCSYDPETRGDAAGGGGAGARKVKGTIHWVSAEHAHKAEVRLYDRLFMSDAPGASGGDVMAELNPNSLVTLKDCLVEPSLAKAGPGEHFQFERLGFFFTDPADSKPGAPVFNRTVQLKDTWANRGAATATATGTGTSTDAGTAT